MSARFEGWTVGVDFDNTIACYDELMHSVALERGLIAAEVVKAKKVIRDAIRALPGGEEHWRSLQVTVYGPRMHEARLIDGVTDFFADCRRWNVPVYVVSHKTEYANFGEAGVNLRAVAMAWLDQHGFFNEERLGLSKSGVFFESTRAEKIDRIKALRATHYIDDLEEVFCDRAFPRDVEKILLAEHSQPGNMAEASPFSSWKQIREHLFGNGVAAR